MLAQSTLQTIKEKLIAAHKTLGCVESITGGGVAYEITKIDGASQFFVGGVVTYASELKQSLLNIDASVFSDHGVYSHEMVKAMAEKGKNLLSCDYCISLSGLAGPSGGTPENPVGTVYLGLSTNNMTISKVVHIDASQRQEVREKAVVAALKYLCENI